MSTSTTSASGNQEGNEQNWLFITEMPILTNQKFARYCELISPELIHWEDLLSQTVAAKKLFFSLHVLNRNNFSLANLIARDYSANTFINFLSLLSKMFDAGLSTEQLFLLMKFNEPANNNYRGLLHQKHLRADCLIPYFELLIKMGEKGSDLSILNKLTLLHSQEDLCTVIKSIKNRELTNNYNCLFKPREANPTALPPRKLAASSSARSEQKQQADSQGRKRSLKKAPDVPLSTQQRAIKQDLGLFVRRTERDNNVTAVLTEQKEDDHHGNRTKANSTEAPTDWLGPAIKIAILVGSGMFLGSQFLGLFFAGSGTNETEERPSSRITGSRKS